MKKGAIYSRVSTLDQDYNKQTAELKEFATRNDIDIVYVFEEKISGFNDSREEFEKLKRLTKADIDIVLIWELSRLSRRSIFIQQQVREFADKGICIFTKKEGLYTLDSDGKENKNAMFIVGIISMIAEQEITTLKERTISSKRHKILNEGNSYTSSPPYGYDYNPLTKKLTINEKEAEIVKKIFELSANGYSSYRIPVFLNSEGIKSKKGGNWTVSTIATMLCNPVYTGKANFTLKSEKTKTSYRKPVEIAIVNVPAIISSELYNLYRFKAQERTNRSKSIATKYNPLLRGLIKCTDCGCGYTYHNRDGLYSCHSKYAIRSSYEKPKCKSKSIKASRIEPIVWELITNLFNTEITISKMEEYAEPLKERLNELVTQIAGIDNSISELTTKANAIINIAMDIKIKFPHLTDLYSGKLQEIEVINKEVGRYNSEKDLLLKEASQINKRIEAIEDMSDYIITDETEKYDLIHKVLDCIKIYGYDRNSIITVELKVGEKYNIFYKNRFKGGLDYCIVHDSVVTFCSPNHLPEEIPEHIKAMMKDFDVTYNNNELFNEEVFGSYSMSEMWDILTRYGYVKHLD